jgi:basic amino acid/polyamine antiporter, APA family
MSEAYVTKPSLGIWRAASLVTGNIIGAGIFMLPASLGVYGTIGLFGLILTAAGAICLALVFARLSHDFPKIGGPYAYSREAFGDFIGFQMAWSYWVGTWASVAAITIAFVSYLSIFWPELNDNVALAFLVSLSIVWLFTLINLRGVRTAGTVQLGTTILKIIPLIIIAILGFPQISFDNFLPINPSGEPFWTALSSAAALTLFSFVGLESATIPAEDVQNPRKTIPRATVLGTLFAAIIYIGTMIVIVGMLTPQELANSKAPFVDAGAYIFGSWAGPFVAGAAMLCCLGTLNGWILVQAQMPVAIARDGLFPVFFDQHTKNGTPYVALIISSVLISILLFMNFEAGLVEQFNTIVFFTTFTVILTYLYSTSAELYLLLTKPQSMSKRRFIRALCVTVIAFCYMMFILIGAGERAAFLGMIFVFSGFPLYVFMKRGHNKALTEKTT